MQNAPMGCGNNLLTLLGDFRILKNQIDLQLDLYYWHGQFLVCLGWNQTDPVDRGNILGVRGKCDFVSKTLPQNPMGGFLTFQVTV